MRDHPLPCNMSEEVFTDEGSARFFQLVHMFQRTALVHLGVIPDHEGNTHWIPAEAKASIDMLTMLQDRTAGNLEDAEAHLLRGVISELQLTFVKAPDIKRAKEREEAEAEIAQQAFTDPKEGPVEVITDDGGSKEEE